MENKSLATNLNVPSHKTTNTENESLEKNEFIFKLMEKLTIEDFPVDIPQKSKQNIEKAIRATKMRNCLDIGNKQTLLGLEDHRIANLQLTYQEKKFISEQVQRLIDLEELKLPEYEASQQENHKLTDKFVEKQNELIAITERLLIKKCEELQLMLEVTEEVVSPNYKKQVELLLQKSKIQLLQIKIFNHTIQKSEISKTIQSKEALEQVSLFLDSMLEDIKNDKE